MVGLRHPQTVAAQPDCRQALLSPLPPEPPLSLLTPRQLVHAYQESRPVGHSCATVLKV
jgi:hypothetical protein